LERKSAVAVGESSARRQKSLQWLIAVVAAFYALLLGVLNISLALGIRFDGIFSNIERHVHVATESTAVAPPLLLGLFMLFIAYQLWLKKKAAIVILSLFLVVESVADVFRGMSPVTAGVSIIVAGVLLSSIKEFPARPDPASFKRFKVVLPVLGPLFFVYGVVGLYLMRDSLDLASSPYSLAYRAAMIAVGDSGSLSFTGWSALYRGSLIILASIGFIYLTVLLFRPYREKVGQMVEDHGRARELVGRYGSDSLAYFNLRMDKNLFFYSDKIFIAYRCVGGIAVISGDPVGPAELVPEILAEFKKYCAERGWRFMSLGARGRYMPLYEEAGLKGFMLGEEAIINLDGFSLDGRKVRKLRQSVNKLEKTGVTMEFMFNAGIPAHMKHELQQISADWRGGKPETGFSMGLGRFMVDEDPDCLLSIAYDGEMKPMGFLYMVPMYPHLGYSIDINRTMPGAPRSLIEFMIARTALFLKENGYQSLSLHFSALSQHYRADREEPGSAPWRAVARAIDHVLPVISLYNFDRKFTPGWTSRYIIYQSLLDFPLAGLAAVSIESALKLRNNGYQALKP